MSAIRRRHLVLTELDSRVLPTVTATFSGGLLTITGDDFDNTIKVGADTSGAMTIVGVTSPPTGLTLASCQAIIVLGLGGNDGINLSDLPVGSRTIFVDGGTGRDFITGTAGPDALAGGDGDDVIQGGAGDDVLNGDAGSDQIVGDLGNDVIDGGTGSDTLTGGAGDDAINGGTDPTGKDKDFVSESADVDLVATDHSLVGLGSDRLDSVEAMMLVTTDNQLAGDFRGVKFDATSCSIELIMGGANGPDTLLGGRGNDFLGGYGGNDSLVGGSGNDRIEGQSGSDVLFGGDGDDTLEGLAGDDSLFGGNGSDQILEFNADFTSPLKMTLTNTRLIGLGTDTLSGIEIAKLLGGNNDDYLNAAAFTLGSVNLVGGDGNDTLIGGKHNDTLQGGAGLNSLNGGAGFDTIQENSFVPLLNPVLRNNRLTSSDSQHRLILTSLTAIERADLTGDGTLDASAFTLGSVSLTGGLGNDTLIGSKQSDVLRGGDGADFLDGRAGVDTVFEIADFAPELDLTASALTVPGDPSRTDTFVNMERARLQADADGSILSAAAFSIGPVTLVGGAGNDSLVGGAGDDVLTGGPGLDSLAGGNGTDTLVESSSIFSSFDLSDSKLFEDNQANPLTGIERADLTQTGKTFAFVVSDWTGEADLRAAAGRGRIIAGRDADFALSDSSLSISTGGHFNLTGFTTALLQGGIGDNSFTLTGWTGFAQLFGQAGSDRLVAQANANLQLSDTVFRTSLGSNVFLDSIELATITSGSGSNVIDASGFSGSVTLVGGSGNDTLIGGTGADSLDGGTGNDLIFGQAGNDTLIGGDGLDTLFGGDGDDFLSAGAGNDFLDGEAGTDTLNGGLGTDVGFNGETLIAMP